MSNRNTSPPLSSFTFPSPIARPVFQKSLSLSHSLLPPRPSLSFKRKQTSSATTLFFLTFVLHFVYDRVTILSPVNF